jgi:hypothetical protein
MPPWLGKDNRLVSGFAAEEGHSFYADGQPCTTISFVAALAQGAGRRGFGPANARILI